MPRSMFYPILYKQRTLLGITTGLQKQLDKFARTGQPKDALDRYNYAITIAPVMGFGGTGDVTDEEILSLIVALSIDPQFEEFYYLLDEMEDPEEYLYLLLSKAKGMYPVKQGREGTIGEWEAFIGREGKYFTLQSRPIIEAAAQFVMEFLFLAGSWQAEIPWSSSSPPYFDNFTAFLPRGFNGHMLMPLIERVESFRGWGYGEITPNEVIKIGQGLMTLMIDEVNQRFENYWEDDPFIPMLRYWFTGKPIDEENQCDYLQNYLVGDEYKPEGSHTLINFLGEEYVILWET